VAFPPRPETDEIAGYDPAQDARGNENYWDRREPETQNVYGRRKTAVGLALVGTILLLVALVIPWWFASFTEGQDNGMIQFLPGSQYSGSGVINDESFSGSQQYSAANLTNVGNLYGAVLDGGLLAGVLGFVAIFLGFFGARGSFQTRTPLYLILVALGLTALIVTVMPLWVASAQPGAFAQDGTFAGSGGGCPLTSSPCNTFWGSASVGSDSVSWGAGFGWYLTIVAAIFLWGSFAFYVSTRKEEFTHQETWSLPPAPPSPLTPLGVPGPGSPSVPSTAWSPPSPPPVTAPPPAAPRPAFSVPCPRCGSPATLTAPYTRYFCPKCQAFV
jgi:hypothetical protein